MSTLLPYFPNDPQQVERKRHIGNDMVVIIFKEGNFPFNPSLIHSQFPHIYLLIQLSGIVNGIPQFQFQTLRHTDVPEFGPPTPSGVIPANSPALKSFILTKVINGENAALKAPTFANKLRRTRQETLKLMITPVSK